jgi:hypothetical protein
LLKLYRITYFVEDTQLFLHPPNVLVMIKGKSSLHTMPGIRNNYDFSITLYKTLRKPFKSNCIDIDRHLSSKNLCYNNCYIDSVKLEYNRFPFDAFID